MLHSCNFCKHIYLYEQYIQNTSRLIPGDIFTFMQNSYILSIQTCYKAENTSTFVNNIFKVYRYATQL